MKYVSSDLALAFAAMAIESGSITKEQYENKKTLLTASRYKRTGRPVSYISRTEKRGVLK